MPLIALVTFGLCACFCAWNGLRMMLRPEQQHRRMLGRYRRTPWLESLDPYSEAKRRRSYVRWIRRAGTFSLLWAVLMGYALLICLLGDGVVLR